MESGRGNSGSMGDEVLEETKGSGGCSLGELLGISLSTGEGAEDEILSGNCRSGGGAAVNGVDEGDGVGKLVGLDDEKSGDNVTSDTSGVLDSSLFNKLLVECSSSLPALLMEMDGERPCMKMEDDDFNGAGSGDKKIVGEGNSATDNGRPSNGSDGGKAAISGFGSLNSTACNSGSNSRRASSSSPWEDVDDLGNSGLNGQSWYPPSKRRSTASGARSQCREALPMTLSSSSAEILVHSSSEEVGTSLTDGSSLRYRGGNVGGENADSSADGKDGSSGSLQRAIKALYAKGDASPVLPLSPSYLNELRDERLLEVVSPESDMGNGVNIGSRNTLGYYSVNEAANTGGGDNVLYPVVRGVSRDNTKKRWAVYWKGYRRYFYDKFFASCVEAYRRAVQFRQQATTASSCPLPGGLTAEDVAAISHDRSTTPQAFAGPKVKGSFNRPKTVKEEHRQRKAVVRRTKKDLDAAQMAMDGVITKEAPSDTAEQMGRPVVSLYKEAILYVLEDLRKNVVVRYLTTRATNTVNAASMASGQAVAVEMAAAQTAKRLLEQLLNVHINMVTSATTVAELQPSLLIVSPCLEELKLPSQQKPQQQLLILQSILATHIQQLLLLSRYLNKGVNSQDASGVQEPKDCERVGVSTGILRVATESVSVNVSDLKHGD